jgi:hypothetical protein
MPMKNINGTNSTPTSNDESAQCCGLHLALCCCRQCRGIFAFRVGQEASERKAMACGGKRITFGSPVGWHTRRICSVPSLSTQNSQAQLYESSAGSCCSASCGVGLDTRKGPTMKIPDNIKMPVLANSHIPSVPQYTRDYMAKWCHDLGRQGDKSLRVVIVLKCWVLGSSGICFYIVRHPRVLRS